MISGTLVAARGYRRSVVINITNMCMTYMLEWEAVLSFSSVIRGGRRSIWAAFETSDITAVKVLFPPPPHASS